MKYKVTFQDEIDAETPEGAYEILLDYLKDCVNFGDVTSFKFVDENKKEH
jgi:hypothetical protein